MGSSECRVDASGTAAIVADPETFPNWKRSQVANAAKWDPNADPAQIAHELRLAGAGDEIYTLSSPAKIRAANPANEKVGPIVDTNTIDTGHHVRLKYLSRPVAEGETTEEKPKAKAKAKPKAAPKKAPAKKAAAKKAAKKGAAKTSTV